MKTSPNGNKHRQLGFYALILVLLLVAVYSMTNETQVQPVPYSEIVDLFQQEKVESFTTTGNTLVLNLREEYNGSKTMTKELPDFTVFYSDLND